MLNLEQLREQYRQIKRAVLKRQFQNAYRDINTLLPLLEKAQTNAEKIFVADVYVLKADIEYKQYRLDDTIDSLQKAVNLYCLHLFVGEKRYIEALEKLQQLINYRDYTQTIISSDNHRKNNNFDDYYRQIMQSPTFINSIIKFPHYVFDTYPVTEPPDYNINKNDQDLLNTLLLFSQHYGHAKGLQFAENHILKPGAKAGKAKAFNLKPEQVIELTLALHYQLFQHCSIATRHGQPAGEYTLNRVYLPRETIKKGIHFNGQIGHKANLLLLSLNGYGPQELVYYMEFSNLIIDKQQQISHEMKKLTQSDELTLKRLNELQAQHDDYNVIEMLGLKQHPGYSIYKRTTDWGCYGHDITIEMESFAKQYVQMLSEVSCPFEIADYVIKSFSKIIPFAIGSGRIGRLWASITLMLHGIPPIHFPGRDTYNFEFDKAYHGDDSLVELFKENVKRFHNNPELDEHIDYDALTVDANDDSITLKNDELVLVKNNKQQIFTEEAMYAKGAQLLNRDSLASVVFSNLGSLFYFEPQINHYQAATNALISGNNLRVHGVFIQFHHYKLASDLCKIYPNLPYAKEALKKYEAVQALAEHIPSPRPAELTHCIQKYKTNDVCCAFRRAAGKGDIEDLKLLQKYVYSIDAIDNTDYGRTALHWATVYRHWDTVDYLLSINADHTIKDRGEHQTPQEYDPYNNALWPGTRRVLSNVAEDTHNLLTYNKQ